jgi:hypothetical protein
MKIKVNRDIHVINCCYRNNALTGGGNLQTSHYQTMANYMSKFITAYGNAGVPIWYIYYLIIVHFIIKLIIF